MPALRVSGLLRALKMKGESARAATPNLMTAKRKGSNTSPASLTTTQLVATRRTKRLHVRRPRTLGGIFLNADLRNLGIQTQTSSELGGAADASFDICSLFHSDTSEAVDDDVETGLLVDLSEAPLLLLFPLLFKLVPRACGTAAPWCVVVELGCAVLVVVPGAGEGR